MIHVKNGLSLLWVKLDSLVAYYETQKLFSFNGKDIFWKH